MPPADRGAFPPPESDASAYAQAVWSLHREHLAGNTPSEDRMPADPWVKHFLECAARAAAGQPLGGGRRTEWLSRQRRAYARGELPPGQMLALEQLRGFSWAPSAARWQDSFDRVRAFTFAHGRIPHRSDDAALSGWLATQRFALRAGRLEPARAAKLLTLPGWAESLVSTRSRGGWERRLDEVRAFIDINGRYPATDASDADEARLARWVATQREQYRRGDLSQQRVESLAQLPRWRWTARDADWEARAAALWADSCGSINREHRQYNWLISQRRRHRAGRLSEEQVEILERMNLLAPALTGVA